MMSVIQTVFGWNYVLMVSATSWFVAQVVKTIIDYVIEGSLNLERMVGSGGMPSCHSATVCALAVSTGRYCGISSPLFGIAVMLAIIVMYDARGVRREAGEQAKVLNQLLMDWMEMTAKVNPMLNNKQLKEMVGHTPFQVICGAALGICIALMIPVV